MESLPFRGKYLSELLFKQQFELKASPRFGSRLPTLLRIINFDWTKESNNIKHYNPLFSYLRWSNTRQVNLIQVLLRGLWHFLMTLMKCSLWSTLHSFCTLDLSSIINLGWLICCWSNSVMEYPSLLIIRSKAQEGLPESQCHVMINFCWWSATAWCWQRCVPRHLTWPCSSLKCTVWHWGSLCCSWKLITTMTCYWAPATANWFSIIAN